MPEPLVPMSRPDISEADVEAVLGVLRSGRLALGQQTVAFENAVAERVGTPHAVAVSSGTAALHLALVGLGIGVGDEVLVPSFTFSATISVVFQVGATPVFVDVRGDTFTVDVEDLERKLTPRTRAILVVDVFGHPADWDEISALSRDHGLLVIDDACEALGASHRGRPVGSLGDAAAFGFYPNKQITTGEGGMLVTASAELAEVARSLRNQGRDAMGSWLEHPRLGFNYRMDEMSAALGASQMARSQDLLEGRRRTAASYVRLLNGVGGVRAPVLLTDVEVSWFVFVVLLDTDRSRNTVMDRLASRGVPTRAYFSPIHLQPFVAERLGDLDGTLPVTEDIARRTLGLPFFGDMPVELVERVCGELESALEPRGW